jgi:hypothetical protein
MATTPPPTFGALRSPIADKDGRLHRDWVKKFQEWEAKLYQTIDLVGQISANAKISGRTEGIGTTVGNLTSTGKVNSLDNVNDGAAFVRTVPNEKAGAGRAFNALDVNSRLAATRRATMALASYTPTTTNICTQSGTTTLINIASSTVKFPDGDISYNSGSVDPGAYGTYYVYADDPTFAGGAVAYQASTSNPLVTANDGRAYFGKLTTSAGGGGGSGSSGGGGACFTRNTRVITKDGIKRIVEIVAGDEVLTLRGWRQVRALLTHSYEGELRDMGGDEYVTPSHRFWSRRSWEHAVFVFRGRGAGNLPFAGEVFNLSVEGDGSDDEQCFTLANGHIAHNVLK